MELIDEICRFCLSASPLKKENLFENSVIWGRITLTIKIDLQQQAYLPNCICSTCKAIIDHIYNFHQKIVQNQIILQTKFREGINSLQDFYSNLNSVKKENIDDSCVNIGNEIKTDEEINHLNFDEVKCDENDINFVDCTNETVFQKPQRNLSAKTKTTVKCKMLQKKVNENIGTEIEILIKAEDCVEPENENTSITDTYCKIKEENSVYDDFATISNSDDDDWSPEAKPQKTVKKRVIHNFAGDVNEKTNDNKIYKKVNDTNDEYDDQIIVNRENSNEQSKKSEEDNAAYTWKCLTCFEIFPNRKLLISHFKSKHKPEIAVSLDINPKNFTTVTEDNKMLYKCGYCGKLRKKKAIKEHIMTHDKLRPYVCNMCARKFRTIYEIVKHSRMHDGNRVFCSYKCGYSSVYPIKLKEHEMRRHGGEFKQHRLEKKYLCDLCGKSCMTSSHLIDHRRIHGDERPFVCSECGKSFKQRNKLVRHLRTHSDPRPHGCPHCAKRYARPVGLRHHIATECDKSFKQRNKLVRHLRTHSDPRPHGCLHCAKRYARPVGLRHHIATCHGKIKQKRKTRKRRRDSNSS